MILLRSQHKPCTNSTDKVSVKNRRIVGIEVIKMTQVPGVIKNQSQLEGRSSDEFARRKLDEEASINKLIVENGIPRETAELMVNPPQGTGVGYKCERLG